MAKELYKIMTESDYSLFNQHFELIDPMVDTDEDEHVVMGFAIRAEDRASFLFDLRQLVSRYGAAIRTRLSVGKDSRVIIDGTLGRQDSTTTWQPCSRISRGSYPSRHPDRKWARFFVNYSRNRQDALYHVRGEHLFSYRMGVHGSLQSIIEEVSKMEIHGR